MTHTLDAASQKQAEKPVAVVHYYRDPCQDLHVTRADGYTAIKDTELADLRAEISALTAREDDWVRLDDKKDADLTASRETVKELAGKIENQGVELAHLRLQAWNAREAFLGVLADAAKFEHIYEMDADDDGRPTVCVNAYKLDVPGSAFEELCDAFGITPTFYDDTYEIAIGRALEETVERPALDKLDQPVAGEGAEE